MARGFDRGFDDDYARRAMRNALDQLNMASQDRREADMREFRQILELMNRQTTDSSTLMATPSFRGPRQQQLRLEFDGRRANINVIMPDCASMEYVARELSQYVYRLLREYPQRWSSQGEQQSENEQQAEDDAGPAERLDPAFE